MNNYGIINCSLKNLQYNFTKPNIEQIKITINDEIQITQVFDNKARLMISRSLHFGPDTNSYVNVVFEVIIDNDDDITKESLIKALKKDIVCLTSVFAKISVLISQVTGLSLFSPLVTAPSYDPAHTKIE